MLFLEFVSDNYVMIYELIGLFVLLGFSVHISKKSKRLHQIALIFLILETFAFYMERWTQTFEELSIWRPLLTSLIYSIYPLILIILMQITSTHTLSRKIILLLLIPEFISVPLYFTSQWTHIVYYYHEDNTYAGGAINTLPYIIFGLYVGLFLIHNFIYFKNTSKKNYAIMSYVLIFPFIGVVFYKITDSGKDYVPLFTSAILLYFACIYIHLAKTDALTLLLNRQSYYKHLEDGKKKITGVVSVDMNDLSYLNNTFGHEEGDLALVTVSRIMKQYCGYKGTPYRVGGDEFMILYSGAEENEIEKQISIMQEKMSETKYMCAFGYSMHQSSEEIEETIRRSDKKMYENKAEIKSKVNRNDSISQNMPE